MTVRTAQTAKTSHWGSERPAWGRHRVQKISCREAARETGFTEVPILGALVTLNVAGIKLIRARAKNQGANCVHRPLASPVRKKCIFFTEEVRTTCTVCTCTHLYGELKQIKTNYRLYFGFPYVVRTVQVI